MVLRRNKSGYLPRDFDLAHDLCFVIHDILVQLLVSGERVGAFSTTFSFRDGADRQALEEAEDVFAWLESTRRVNERAALLITTVFPALLSDTLHCVYEALETSRKAKLNITYMLLRKPLQESLYLFECMAVDRVAFAETLASEPMKLRGLKAGGLDVHTRRVESVLRTIGKQDRFSAAFLTQLRYDKSAQDGFDGVCNHAMHLFTEHHAIRTENLNINFIFSGREEKVSQWAYLYHRLPYLLEYTRALAEHLAAGFAPTHPRYLEEMDRRVSALVLLWWRDAFEAYKTPELEQFVSATRDALFDQCRRSGFSVPDERHLVRMSKTGAFPDEPLTRVFRRHRYHELGELLGSLRARRRRRQDGDA